MCVVAHAYAGTRVCVLSHVQLFVTPWIVPTWLLCPWSSPGKNTLCLLENFITYFLYNFLATNVPQWWVKSHFSNVLRKETWSYILIASPWVPNYQVRQNYFYIVHKWSSLLQLIPISLKSSIFLPLYHCQGLLV